MSEDEISVKDVIVVENEGLDVVLRAGTELTFNLYTACEELISASVALHAEWMDPECPDNFLTPEQARWRRAVRALRGDS